MNQPYDFRTGNIVDYGGPLGYESLVRILGIDPFDVNTERYTLEKYWGEKETFVGYTEHIRPIFFTDHHLRRLGFSFDEKLKRYHLNGFTIGSFGYAEGEDPMHLTYVSLGFRVIPNLFPALPTVDQVKQSTIEIPFLHSLQNYCSDSGRQGLNFDLVTALV